MTAVRVVVRGRVQGVGYRWFVRDAASAHGASGWVRNRRDGSVEALLCGAADAVDAVLTAMAEGPAHARIDEIATMDAASDPADTPAGFEIRSTA